MTDNRPKYYTESTSKPLRRLFGINGYKRVKDLKDADIVVFGNDCDTQVSPFLYGGHAKKGVKYSLTTDRVDIGLLRACTSNQVKVGFGRGAQILNVMLGNGKLDTLVDSLHIHEAEVHSAYEGTKRNSLYIRVPSSHTNVMVPGDTGDVLLFGGEKGKAFDTWTVPEAIVYVQENAFCFQPKPDKLLSDKMFTPCVDWLFDNLDTYYLTKVQEDARKQSKAFKQKWKDLV